MRPLSYRRSKYIRQYFLLFPGLFGAQGLRPNIYNLTAIDRFKETLTCDRGRTTSWRSHGLTSLQIEAESVG